MSQFFIDSASGPPPPSVPTVFHTQTGGDAIPALNILNLIDQPGITWSAQAPGSNNLVATISQVLTGYINVTNAMSPYTVLPTDYFISCDTSTGVITILLPMLQTQYREFVVKDRTGNASASNVTVTTVGGAVLIDGAASQTLSDPYDSLDMLMNGSSYEIF